MNSAHRPLLSNLSVACLRDEGIPVAIALASVAHASIFIDHLLYARPYSSRIVTGRQTQALFSACSPEGRQTEEQGHRRKN